MQQRWIKMDSVVQTPNETESKIRRAVVVLVLVVAMILLKLSLRLNN
jgi:hypothetical protein